MYIELFGLNGLHYLHLFYVSPGYFCSRDILAVLIDSFDCKTFFEVSQYVFKDDFVDYSKFEFLTNWVNRIDTKESSHDFLIGLFWLAFLFQGFSMNILYVSYFWKFIF